MKLSIDVVFDKKKNKCDVDVVFLKKLLEGICDYLCERDCMDFDLFDDRSFSIAILITDNKGIQKYNLSYRGIDKPTNVLSFPNLEVKKDLKNLLESEDEFLGDIVFSIEKIREEATIFSKNECDRFFHLFIHSVLHLLDFDHISDSDREEMEKIEVEVMKKFSLGDPYLC